jgi:ketosteroid isomerase-like protein
VSALEVIQVFYDAYDADDKPRFESVLHPDVEFLPLTRELLCGRTAMLQLLADIEEHFRVYEVRPEQLIEVGTDAVFAELHRCTRTHRGDVTMEDRFAQAFVVEQGLIRRIESYKTVADALASLEQTA